MSLLNRKLIDAAGGRCRRLAVLMPPRHGKSLTVSHFFPAWFLGTYPDRRVILTGATGEFAASWGRKARNVLEEFGPRVFGVEVSPDSSAAGRWDVRRHTGGMDTAGVGGMTTGKGAHALIIDDPVRDAEQAMSATIRQKHWDWYLSVLDTRLEPGAAVILVMTRWHHDDLGGRILAQARDAGEPWDVIRLPALAEADDPLGRPEGAALWPERYSADDLASKRRRMAFWFEALYQQRPTPAGGAIVKAEWFAPPRRYSVSPGGDAFSHDGTGGVTFRPDLLVFAVLDPAVGKTAAADEAACGVFGLTPGGTLLVLHMLGERIPLEDLPGRVAAVCRAWGCEFVACEANGFQVAVAGRLRELLDIPVREVEPEGKGKVVRATRFIELACAGRVLLPTESQRPPWVGPYLEELTQWTGADGDKDNRVDASAYAARLAREYAGHDGGGAFAASGAKGGGTMSGWEG